MTRINFFFRHSHPIYFSIEKLFHEISGKISSVYSSEFIPFEQYLPFDSKLSTIRKNIHFIKKKQECINHITGDIHYAILGCSKKNINIITIHDCVSLHRYKSVDPKYWIIKKLWYDLPTKKADAVVVISENTKKELLHFTKCNPAKIKVIGNFVDPSFQPQTRAFNTECPRVLFIGNTPNKNLNNLIEAIKGISVGLDIVGSLSQEQIKKMTEYGISFSESAGLTNKELIEKYESADLLAFPSTYEGFGLPIIEAQAVGRPVLTSDLSPMNEVAGAGACLVDPYNIDSIRSGLQRIVKDAAYRNSLINYGFDNVKRFTLDKVTEQYVVFYRELLQKKKLN